MLTTGLFAARNQWGSGSTVICNKARGLTDDPYPCYLSVPLLFIFWGELLLLIILLEVRLYKDLQVQKDNSPFKVQNGVLLRI